MCLSTNGMNHLGLVCHTVYTDLYKLQQNTIGYLLKFIRRSEGLPVVASWWYDHDHGIYDHGILGSSPKIAASDTLDRLNRKIGILKIFFAWDLTVGWIWLYHGMTRVKLVWFHHGPTLVSYHGILGFRKGHTADFDFSCADSQRQKDHSSHSNGRILKISCWTKRADYKVGTFLRHSVVF